MKIDKWHCKSCDTNFYVENEYLYQPYCTNCGEENTEFLKEVEVKEDKPNGVSSR